MFELKDKIMALSEFGIKQVYLTQLFCLVVTRILRFRRCLFQGRFLLVDKNVLERDHLYISHNAS